MPTVPDDNAGEQWRTVVGYEGVYEVSAQGSVKRILASAGAKAGRILKASMRTEYPCVHLSFKGKDKMESVHAIVAAAFIGPRPPGMFVNHKDAIKSHSYLSNLEYVTPKENDAHAKRLGLKPIGERHWCSKLNEKQVLEIRRLKGKMSQRAISKLYPVTEFTISDIMRRKIWRNI